MDRQGLGNQSLDELANFKGSVTAGSANDQAANAEFMRRQALWQEQATIAAQKEADAAERTAQFTRKTARYMWWSVLAILASAAIQAFVTVLSWVFPQH